jgi:hypothetical protein
MKRRLALDANMVDGEGGVAATAVTADGTLNDGALRACRSRCRPVGEAALI